MWNSTAFESLMMVKSDKLRSRQTDDFFPKFTMFDWAHDFGSTLSELIASKSDTGLLRICRFPKTCIWKHKIWAFICLSNDLLRGTFFCGFGAFLDFQCYKTTCKTPKIFGWALFWILKFDALFGSFRGEDCALFRKRNFFRVKFTLDLCFRLFSIGVFLIAAFSSQLQKRFSLFPVQISIICAFLLPFRYFALEPQYCSCCRYKVFYFFAHFFVLGCVFFSCLISAFTRLGSVFFKDLCQILNCVWVISEWWFFYSDEIISSQASTNSYNFPISVPAF